ncbi:MAG: ring,2-phenylacetyl-CoA epoxidase subunit PaaD, partial [Sphingomonadales bacterium]|nr:ring,2-phenylacetyl-CoA epoxidase subunit PaaD [Sphingomonadales bacterium]
MRGSGIASTANPPPLEGGGQGGGGLREPLGAGGESTPPLPLPIKGREEQIRQVLASVPDPEIPVVSVVDLGIVRAVEPDRVVITPTYTGG